MNLNLHPVNIWLVCFSREGGLIIFQWLSNKYNAYASVGSMIMRVAAFT